MDEPLPSAAQAFNYDIVNKGKVKTQVYSRAYEVKPDDHNIFVNMKMLGGKGGDLGWKIHVSLDESSENLSKAWNLIVDVLARHGVERSKVLKKGYTMPEFQFGKEITIYYQSVQLNWNQILHEVSELFIKNGVRPNFKALKDFAIPGSIYFSCRCDIGPRGKYVSGLQVDTHNPSGKSHFFETLTVNSEALPQHNLQKPRRNNEENVKNFYRMLEVELGTCIDNLYTKFDRVNSKYYNYRDDSFFGGVRNYYTLPENAAANLTNCLKLINILRRQFEEGTIKIESLSNSEFKAYFEKCVGDLKLVNLSINEIMEQILKAEAQSRHSDSDEGSVKYHSSGSDDDDPGKDFSQKDKEAKSAAKSTTSADSAATKQESAVTGGPSDVRGAQSSIVPPSAVISAAQHALRNQPISGMERMIMEVADVTGGAIEAIEALEPHQIQNVFKIIQSQKHNSDPVHEVIIAAMESKKITLDQIKDISDEMKGKIDIALGYKLTSPTLKIEDILSAAESIQKRVAASAHTSLLPPDSSKVQAPPHKQH